MSTLVSIIIPVYNAGKVIRRCIDSLLVQTFTDFQIIVVNDGSTDNSEEICREYEQNNAKIKLISIPNSGVGTARNIGIDAAEGKYVGFIDADDYVHKEYVEKLVSLYENNDVHMAICGFMEIWGEKIVFETSGDKTYLDCNKAQTLLLKENYYRGYVWNKLFERTIIQKHHLRFDENIAIWEDVQFVFRYMNIVDKIVYDPKPMYYYMFSANSSSNLENNNKALSKAYSVIKAQKSIEQEIPKQNTEALHELHMREMSDALGIMRIIGITNVKCESEEYKECVKLIRKLLKETYGNLHKKERLVALFATICPRLLVSLYRIHYNRKNM